MKPTIIDNHYCFDSLQARFLAKEIHNSPLKDSLINQQEKEIGNLNDIIIKQDTIIEVQKSIIVNDSIIIENQKEAILNEKTINEVSTKEHKRKYKKLKLIAVFEGVLLFTCLMLK